MTTQPRPLVFLDTETTSLAPDRKAWEVALIRVDGTDVNTTTFYVNVDLTRADPTALNIGGYYDRHPHGRGVTGKYRPSDSETLLEPYYAASTIARATHGATIVGACPWFDTEHLAHLMRRHGFLPAWHHRLRCVESMTAGHLGRDVGGLADSATALGIDFPLEERHTALGDADIARRIYNHLTGGRT